MKLTVTTKLETTQDVIVLGITENAKDYYKASHKSLHAELQDAIKKKLFKASFGQIFSTRVSSKEYVVVGLGEEQELTLDKVRRAIGKAVKHAKSKRAESLSVNIPFVTKAKFNPEHLGRATAEALLLADYTFVKYLAKDRQEKKMPIKTASILWTGDARFENGLKAGKVISEATNLTRDLVNEPAGVANSVFLEKVAKSVAASSSKIKIKVLGPSELKKLGMNLMLGVNAGSKNPAKLILLEYNGGKAKEKRTAFVGKGITFDSGGYNLKPTKYIEDMKTDMGGAAAVLGTIKAAAGLGIKKNLLGVMGVCENMVSSMAQHPGDIVRGYNGKTVEIGNTDAEGRLVLADALAFVEDKYKPEVMVDLATLTGACVVALGYYTAALMGREKDTDLLTQLHIAGTQSGDRVWQLPFFDEYQDWMDGNISDLNNISQKGKGYEGGSITAGVFLSKFVEKTKWAHIDIAGSGDWSVDGDYIAKGPTGSGVRVLSYWLLNQ